MTRPERTEMRPRKWKRWRPWSQEAEKEVLQHIWQSSTARFIISSTVSHGTRKQGASVDSETEKDVFKPSPRFSSGLVLVSTSCTCLEASGRTETRILRQADRTLDTTNWIPGVPLLRAIQTMEWSDPTTTERRIRIRRKMKTWFRLVDTWVLSFYVVTLYKNGSRFPWAYYASCK